jgi:hypothetical protein
MLCPVTHHVACTASIFSDGFNKLCDEAVVGAMSLFPVFWAGDHAAAAAAPSAADGHATGSTADAAAAAVSEDPAAAAGQGAGEEEAVVVEGSAADRDSSKASLQRYRKVGRCPDRRPLVCRPGAQPELAAGLV